MSNINTGRSTLDTFLERDFDRILALAAPHKRFLAGRADRVVISEETVEKDAHLMPADAHFFFAVRGPGSRRHRRRPF